ncbi:S1C family serine protease [Phytohabitans sp. ZYX-F-186]|uniref:S1C family serine protease n=1 Tax=Phytohabitans maris TaxID=3071409 RepID=A0ABU0ZHK3_9ACTN|nr:S1C family serine protease [Phytohabitans sp. ZYX-F-186]MDQ7906540.1 S1C family serine protease [Phytohabitans sp. ZYX-F-186]
MTAGYDPLSAQPGAQVPGPRHSLEEEVGVAPAGPPASGPPRTDDPDGLYRPGPPPPPPQSPPFGAMPPPPGPAYPPPPPAAFPAPAYPLSAPPMSGLPGGEPQYAPYPPIAAPPPPRRRPSWLGLSALVLALILGAVAIVQSIQIRDLQGRVADGDRALAEAQAADKGRMDGLDGRTAELETAAGKAFNPEAISSEVLPSVFRVSAGQFTGTAFAVGQQSGSTTNLFTNFHVVESVWVAGQREVFIERKDQRWPATIVRVDEQDDVAQLRTNNKFTGLATAREAAKSGQQIVVVGAPLGLEDTVTTGVISAIRKDEGGSGTVIQFDAPINPGNSGGPVVNAAKQVVGIATAKARDAEGIGLAVPIKTACDEFKIC